MPGRPPTIDFELDPWVRPKRVQRDAKSDPQAESISAYYAKDGGVFQSLDGLAWTTLRHRGCKLNSELGSKRTRATRIGARFSRWRDLWAFPWPRWITGTGRPQGRTTWRCLPSRNHFVDAPSRNPSLSVDLPKCNVGDPVTLRDFGDGFRPDFPAQRCSLVADSKVWNLPIILGVRAVTAYFTRQYDHI